MFQNRQVMVTSLGYCWYNGGAPQKMGAGEMEDDRGIIIKDECEVDMQNLWE